MLSYSLGLLGLLLVAQLIVWLISLRLGDASIVDIFWGLGFVLLAAAGLVLGEGALARRLLLATLTGLWGLRLALYLAWRNLGKGEDYRYRAMRAKYGSRFPLLSLFIVFWLQGLIAWVVALPLQAAAVAKFPATLTGLDAAGATLWLMGFLFESIGDWQLARFKSKPENHGKVMDQGLWRYTRHPNYFGDFLLWWGLGLLGLATGAWWALLGPAVMSLFLLRVSGVALLEKTIGQRRPAYAEYIRRTSSFFPWPPHSK